MDETLSSLFAKADAVRRQVEEGTIDDIQVCCPFITILTISLKCKNVLPCTKDVNNLSNI
jgi:hypothetical protein